MRNIDEKRVLDFYVGEIEKDSIMFLKNKRKLIVLAKINNFYR